MDLIKEIVITLSEVDKKEFEQFLTRKRPGKNRKDVEGISAFTDGVVVGSSIVNIIKENLHNKTKMINEINLFTKDLKKGITE